MAASQQFCVKWNSYSTNLQSVFPRLLTSEHFVDVTLACEGQMIKCHKVVLSACSTYFERLLVANPCPHPIIFMKDMKHFEVQALVDFMYRGEVNVSQDELNSLLIAAEALQIRGLCGSENMSAVNGRPRSGSQQGHMNTPTSPRAVSSSNETDVPCQPTKRRRSDSDVKPKIVSVTSNGEEVGVAAAYNNSERTSSGEETPGRRHSIKQESLEMDEHGANYPDADGNDEDYDRVDHEDSDGVQQESHTDQAGPSGVGYPSSRSGNTTPDKTATELIEFMALQNVSCQLSLEAANPHDFVGISAQDFSSHLSEPKDYIANTKAIVVSPSQPPDGNFHTRFDLSPKFSPGSHIRIRRSDTELKKAAECIHKGMTFQNVSDIFHIPISTIRFYMARNGILPQRRRGRNTSQAAFVVTHQRLPDLSEVKKE